MSNQQTVLRVQTNIPGSISGSTEYEFLDLYSSIPILINKSFAELGDIGKRNSDYSVGVLLPGSKKNNRFFENYFNVDSQSLFFNPNLRVPCQVLINDEAYFTGYMRLNKVSVMDSKIEYDVTLYSTPAELYGSIGNNLLRDLNFADADYTFNHVFNLNNVTHGFNYDNFALNQEEPYPYFYPIVHNGYEYTGDTVNFSGGTILSRTRLYTSTGPLGSYATLGSAYSAGVQQFRLNSPTQGLYNNQLKPGLNVWSLLQLMFKTYGYSITSDFFNTPWMKTLYMYGYFSSDLTKFAFSVTNIQTLPLSGCEVFFVDQDGKVNAVVAKLGTGIPCFCASDINITLNYVDGYHFNSTIPYGTSGLTFDTGVNFVSGSSSDVPNGTTLKYLPVNVGDTVPYVDNDYVDFSLVIDQNIKQIDLLSSIAKKFNLVLIPDPNNGYNIRIEPYDFFIGTGQIHNWSNLISYDKGFTVEPSLNYIESEIQFSDQEDSDEGNRLFKINNNRIYGQNYVYNPTDFKSEQKRIDTIFSPELIRRWDSSGTTNNGNINLPLGINYAGSNNQIESGTSEKVNWIYKGIKTKPKLFWWMGSFNPFLDILGEHYNATYYYKTYVAYISNSSGSTYNQYDRIPVISHTMPMGNPDKNKINNDSQCILFNSELPATTDIGVQAFNTYTENDAYSTFYEGRVSNLYDPNTRVLSGYFNLSYADLKNLQPQDLIKVNEQHFVVSKIEGFNLTNRELTKVELIQYNGQPKTYTNRYFQYYYCDNPSVKFNFQTDFTNPNLLDTNFGWSVLYDHSIGTLNGTPTGYTSTFKDVVNFSTEVYIPYYIYEISKETYDSSGISWDYDTLHNFIYEQPYGPFQYNMPTFWLNSGSTESGINLFTDCGDFNTTRTTYGILTGSSTNHGAVIAVTPTPTPTPTQTPFVAGRMRGSLLINYEEFYTLSDSNVQCTVNGVLRKLINNETTHQYSTYLYSGDTVNIKLYNSGYDHTINVNRIDYTTDDQYGNMGVYNTFITGVTQYTPDVSFELTFTATTVANSYNFEYVTGVYNLEPTNCGIEGYAIEQYVPTPTPTRTPQPTATPTKTVTPTPSVTSTVTPTNTLTPTKTVTPTPTLTINLSPSPTSSLTATPTVTATVTQTVTPTNTITPTPTLTPGLICYNVDFTNTGLNYWTAPTGVTSVRIECWGRGGAGGRSNVCLSAGGGGGAGAYASKTLSVTPGNVYELFVAYGAPDGYDSWFGTSTTVSARSGANGDQPVNCTDQRLGSGGNGGQASNCIGDIKFSGGYGAGGYEDSTVLAGGGGGAGGPLGNGQSTNNQFGGASGNIPPVDGRGGDGGTGRGDDGQFPGGGGGGGQAGVGALARSSGGAGGPALVRINYCL